MSNFRFKLGIIMLKFAIKIMGIYSFEGTALLVCLSDWHEKCMQHYTEEERKSENKIN